MSTFQTDLESWLTRMDRNGDWDGIETRYAVAFAADTAKEEIRRDVGAGKVPADVATFSQLHDHVDANLYGGFDLWPCLPSEERDDAYQTAFCDFLNAVQNEVDQWLRNGRA